MHIAHNCAMRSSTTCARQAGQQAKKLSSSIALNSDESAVIQKLLLNVHTIGQKNPVLFVISVESSSESVEGSNDARTFERNVFSENYTLQICKTPQRTQ